MRTKEEERELIEKCKQDISHFKVVYLETVNEIFRYIYHFVDDEQHAKDLTSDTFLTAIEGMKSFKFTGVPIKYWLLKIARNKALAFVKSKRFPKEVTDQTPDENENILDTMISEEFQSKIKTVMLVLPPEDKEIINLKLIHDLKFNEIAEVTGEKVSAIKMRYYRALGKIKNQI